jgi:hypothetical protein
MDGVGTFSFIPRLDGEGAGFEGLGGISIDLGD